MHYAITTQHLEMAKKQRNVFMGLLVLSLSVNSLQGLERLFSTEKVIILPPDIQKEVWVRGAEVSESYLEEWAYYLASLLLTVSPTTIQYQTDLVLRHVSPDFYNPLKSQLHQEAEHLKKNNATTVFQPKEVAIDKKAMKATITGTLSSLIGKERVFEKQQVYEMTFTMTQGKFLHLVQFELLNKSTPEEGTNP